MHIIQQKILKLAEKQNLSQMGLHEIGRFIGEEHPQKIKHHLGQLRKKGFLGITNGREVVRKNVLGAMRSVGFFTVPILGSANCGEATIFAEENLEGYLKISAKLLKKKKGIFAIKAEGSSMNRANIEGKSIEDGDYVIIDSEQKNPKNGDYILSIIDGVANIKRYFEDKKNQQIVLLSESKANFPPIYIHPQEIPEYLLNGKVTQVIKKPKLKQKVEELIEK